MSYQIDPVPSWGARIQSRIYEQFKLDPVLNAFATKLLGPQFDALQAAFESLITLTSITDSVGAQLDRLGRYVGQPRAGADDATYQLYLSARIVKNLSQGDPESLYSVFRALLPGNSFLLTKSPIKSFSFLIRQPITDAQAQVAIQFLQAAKGASDGAYLVWQEDVDANMFTFGLTTYAVSATSSGASSLQVEPCTAALMAAAAPTGSVVIDLGLATQETVTYSSISGTTMTLSGTTAQNHLYGSSLELVGDPGLGWADTGETTGGEFAGAASV